MDSFDLLKQTYIENLLKINDEEIFIHHLPDIYFDKGLEILKELEKKLEKEIQNANEIIEVDIDEDEIAFYKSEIDVMNKKLDIIRSIIRQQEQEQEIERENITNGTSKNIIFATTSRGTYVEEDLKNIPEEYYEKILSCFEKLEQGYSDYNEEKQRKMGSANERLKGVHELKEFKIRLIYQVLDSNTVYVSQIIFKKDDFSKKTRETMISRREKVFAEYTKTKQEIEDQKIKTEKTREHESIKQRIYEYLNSRRRGEKNVKK